jgi:hypothetical protein
VGVRHRTSGVQEGCEKRVVAQEALMIVRLAIVFAVAFVTIAPAAFA